MKPFAFDYAKMRARKEEYCRYARGQASRVFQPDGTYRPATENDPRVPHWICPARVSSPHPLGWKDDTDQGMFQLAGLRTRWLASGVSPR